MENKNINITNGEGFSFTIAIVFDYKKKKSKFFTFPSDNSLEAVIHNYANPDENEINILEEYNIKKDKFSNTKCILEVLDKGGNLLYNIHIFRQNISFHKYNNMLEIWLNKTYGAEFDI